ncbi:MAG TPA: hypothetical protein VNZ45_14185 [Bacteroidia bacterium]|jgi:hypothetical protein|nr:hypothetical protein [Bacteroidia bacterium]
MKPQAIYYYIGLVLLTMGLTSCKKDNPVTPNQYVPGPGLTYGANALTTYNGNLIAGSYDTVFQWNGSKWSPLTGSSFGGSTISALQVYNGNLIAAAGNYVESWNGSSWQLIGAFSNGVAALAVYNGNLYAAGFFFSVGGNPDTGIAEWTGSSWIAVGPGLYGGVNALTVYSGNLIAAGGITRSGNTNINMIAQWNGSAWYTVGGFGSILYSVNALAIYNGNLIAGGRFTDIIGPGDTATSIAQWNGSAWASIGTSLFSGGFYNTYIPPIILNFTIYNNNLVAVGYFGLGNSASDLGIWNGSAWSTIAGLTYIRPPNDYSRPSPITFNCCTIYNGNLVISGGFNTAGSLSVSNIAMWNGSAWSAL